MEIALYVRVSTNRQQQSQTIEQQLDRLRAAVAHHADWHLADGHIFRDDGYSGAKFNRPGLDRLRDQASMAAFELVLMTAPDRLARNYVHQVLLIDDLQKVGCRVEFLERPMSEDPHDQLLLHIRGAVAEYERNLIAERMRRGRQAKLQSGLLLPWTVAPYGYVLDPERPRDASRVRLDPVKAEIVRQMFAWYTDPAIPATLYWVAKQLSEQQIPTPTGNSRWNVATIRGILRSPAYAGAAISGRTRPTPARQRKSALQPVGPGQSQRPAPVEEWITIPVPAIVSQETFDLAQKRLDENKQMARRNNRAHDYLLRGLVSCAGCQLACTGRSRQPGYDYYVCRGRTDALRAAQGQRCTARLAPANALDQLVWQDLCHILTDPTLITHELERAQAGEWLPQTLQSRRQSLQATLAQLERQQNRLLEVYLAEVIGRDEFERKRQELAQTHGSLTQQLRQLEAQAQKQLDLLKLTQHIQDFCREIQPTLNTLDFTQRRQLVELLIDRVIVDDGKVEIRYVVPTNPNGENSLFCHLRKDYLDAPALSIQGHNHLWRQNHWVKHIGHIAVPFAFEQDADEAHWMATLALATAQTDDDVMDVGRLGQHLDLLVGAIALKRCNQTHALFCQLVKTVKIQPTFVQQQQNVGFDLVHQPLPETVVVRLAIFCIGDGGWHLGGDIHQGDYLTCQDSLFCLSQQPRFLQQVIQDRTVSRPNVLKMLPRPAYRWRQRSLACHCLRLHLRYDLQQNVVKQGRWQMTHPLQNSLRRYPFQGCYPQHPFFPQHTGPFTHRPQLPPEQVEHKGYHYHQCQDPRPQSHLSVQLHLGIDRRLDRFLHPLLDLLVGRGAVDPLASVSLNSPCVRYGAFLLLCFLIHVQSIAEFSSWKSA
jgi:site-specific DNA recombinase